MKRLLSMWIAAVVIAAAGATIAGVAKAEGAKTIRGELLDLTCYMGHGAQGTKHQECATMCIKEGLPMGLLTKEGAVYVIVEDHDNKDAYQSLKGLAAEQVEVTGEVAEKGGIRSISVTKATKV